MKEKNNNLENYLIDGFSEDAIKSMFVDADGNVYINYDFKKWKPAKIPFPPGTTHFLHFHLKRIKKRHVRQLKR